MNLSNWLNRYKQNTPRPKIQYWENGNGKFERSHDLGSISAALQRGARLQPGGLNDIGTWRSVDWRIAQSLDQNGPKETAAACNDGFDDSRSVPDRVDSLCELRGVTVPLASALLTVYDPDAFGVLDYRHIRALAAVRPRLADPRSYQRFAEFADWIKYHRYRPSIYDKYITEIRNIASAHGLTPHEVEMALESFDRSNS